MSEPTRDEETVERGASEEQSGAPLTPTEEEVSQRPPSDPSEDDGGRGAGLDGGGRG